MHLLPELEAPQVRYIFFTLYHYGSVPSVSELTLFPLLDGDLFDEAMDGGQVNVNGRGEDSPELFDLSRLGESLVAPSPRTCQTPESFLGPTAASLVNLDSLIPANPPAKTKNPFLSGIYCIIGCRCDTHFVCTGKDQECVCFHSCKMFTMTVAKSSLRNAQCNLNNLLKQT